MTGYDIVRSQILIAQGIAAVASGNRVGRPVEDDLSQGLRHPVAASRPKTRRTTSYPDYGRLSPYRSAAVNGIRLDAGTAFSGAVITPFYDSLLVKVTASAAYGSSTPRAGWSARLQEFRIRGVKTNIPFLLNLITHPDVFDRQRDDEIPRRDAGTVRVHRPPGPRDEATFSYIADVIVNGHPEVKRPKPLDRPGKSESTTPRDVAGRPVTANLVQPLPPGDARQTHRSSGPTKFAKWVRNEKSRLFITDTTMRDAHQSLFATRMRTYDMLKVAPRVRPGTPTCSRSKCGAGRRSTPRMRFLKESPWDRLATLRQACRTFCSRCCSGPPNAVGYTNYPTTSSKAFVKESAQAGIDVFRIFRLAVTGLPNLQVGDRRPSARRTRFAEAAICYTGDILDPKRDKYGAEVLRRSRQGFGESSARTSWPSRTWPACSSRSRRRNW